MMLGNKKKIKSPTYKIKHFTKNFSLSQLRSAVAEIKLSYFIIMFLIIAICTAFLLTKSVLAKSNENNNPGYETNDHQLDIKSIIVKNANVEQFKEQIARESDVQFQTFYTENPSLPKDEQIVKQEGVVGKDKLISVKTYMNNQLVEDILVSSQRILDPVPQLVDIGTSEFLAKHHIHIGDTIYTKKDVKLRESTSSASKQIDEIKKFMDVKLLELPSEDWCKISYLGKEGYVESATLTSAYSTPSVINKNRIQKILANVKIDMPLNKPSGLTLDDYKTIFTNLPKDTKKIFSDNYETFYEVEKRYKVNGIFIAAIGIHESAWGTSQIANDKHNLFGYGAYDATPYESSLSFEDYKDGIDTVAKAMAKYYLNTAGTKIYDNEIAVSTYYNGSTVKDVNIRYATDENWHLKVFDYMDLLYNRLQSTLSK